MTDWRLKFRRQPSMPPLAWVAAVRPGEVRVDHGSSVRTFDGVFFEGTWAGPPDMSALPEATTVFGSGMVARDGALVAIPPTHPFECIYHARTTDALVLSNSLPGMLAATGLQLDIRAAEEAGIARGSFAVSKRAASVADARRSRLHLCGGPGVNHGLRGSQWRAPRWAVSVVDERYAAVERTY